MKLLGLSFGRKMANTEILVKEALLGAEELGVEVGMVRVTGLKIEPCRGCHSCARSIMEGGDGKCIIKDDLPFIDEQLMESDGVIVGSPVYVLSPPGLFKTVCDRFGPSHDAAFQMMAKKINEEREVKGKGPDERVFKKRVGAFISIGGAEVPHWLSLGLPMMNLFTFPSQIAIVDQMQIRSVVRYANIVQNEEAVKRARQLGRNVAEAMLNPEDEVKWMGDEQGTCPVCHSNLLTVGKKNPIECPICGISGEIRVDEDGAIRVIFSDEEQKRSRLAMDGKLEHFFELRESFKILEQRMQKEGKELPGLLEKYKGYGEIVKK